MNALADRLHRERDYAERESHGQTERQRERERESTTARREKGRVGAGGETRADQSNLHMAERVRC